jgi:hypothetical protein
MGKSPENSTEIGRKPSGKISSITLSLLALAQGIEIPTEEEFLELADKLEENPPANITPEGLPIILKILRGGNPCL